MRSERQVSHGARLVWLGVLLVGGVAGCKPRPPEPVEPNVIIAPEVRAVPKIAIAPAPRAITKADRDNEIQRLNQLGTHLRHEVAALDRHIERFSNTQIPDEEHVARFQVLQSIAAEFDESCKGLANVIVELERAKANLKAAHERFQHEPLGGNENPANRLLVEMEAKIAKTKQQHAERLAERDALQKVLKCKLGDGPDLDAMRREHRLLNEQLGEIDARLAKLRGE
jgi:hypothetical protein